MAGVQQGGPRFGASRVLPARVFSTVHKSSHLHVLSCLCFLLYPLLLCTSLLPSLTCFFVFFSLSNCPFTLRLYLSCTTPSRHLASCCQQQQRGGGGSVVGETEEIRIFRIWERRKGAARRSQGSQGFGDHLEIGCFSKDLLLRSGKQDRHLPQDTCSPLMLSVILSRDWGLNGLLEPAYLSPIPTPLVSSPLSTPCSLPHIFCTILEET